MGQKSYTNTGTVKNILLPTDFSENSLNAIKYGIRLFDTEAAVFYLLNTYTPVLYDSDYILYSPTSSLSLDEMYEKKSTKGLEQVKDRLQREMSNDLHTFNTISSFNSLNEEIKTQVKKKNIELVIMGTQGATGAAQILFGTNTVHAIKRVTCPLLVIPSGCEFKAPQNILFPTDFQINYTKIHLKLLKQLAKKFNSTISILHVLFEEPLQEDQENSKEILSEYLEELNHRFCFLERITVPEGIYEFQKVHQTELLVMISNKHSFFENLLFRPVINEIGFKIKIPFLVIPSGKFNS